MVDLARVLSLQVLFEDAAAASEVTPAKLAAYLTAKGWTRERRCRYATWRLGQKWVDVAIDATGEEMLDVIADVAIVEGRSPLAVWVEMMENKT